MRRLMLLVVAAVAVLAVSGDAGSAGAVWSRWVIRDLGVAGKYTHAVGINERGLIIGYRASNGHTLHTQVDLDGANPPLNVCEYDRTFTASAFVENDGRVTELGPSSGPSYAEAVNGDGLIVLNTLTAGCDADYIQPSQAFSWRNGSAHRTQPWQGELCRGAE